MDGIHLNTHFTAESDPARIAELVKNFSGGPQTNNSAVRASQSGDYKTSIKLHRETLKSKLKTFGPNAVATAITYNGLGEDLLSSGELKEAEEMLLKAYNVREKDGPAFDAAVTRENLGRLYEIKGDWTMARSVRMEGNKGDRDAFACSNYHCPRQELPLNKMKRCGACSAPLYCSTECQKKDWKTRHKVLCNSRNATK